MTKKQYTEMLCDYPSAMTVNEVAQVLRVSTKTVYKLIKQKEIPAVKVGRENRIAKCNLINYLRQIDKASPNPKYVVSENTHDYRWTCATDYDIVRVGEGKYILNPKEGA